MQALLQGRSWLWLGLIGLAIWRSAPLLAPGRAPGPAAAGGRRRRRARRWSLSGFLIGARGWTFALLNARFGELPVNQFGIGAGGFVALDGADPARAPSGWRGCGCFKGDLFVAGAVVGCGVLMALFIVFPVLQGAEPAPSSTEDGRASLARLRRRASPPSAICGLGCLAGGVRCGVAWNTLLLAC